MSISSPKRRFKREILSCAVLGILVYGIRGPGIYSWFRLNSFSLNINYMSAILSVQCSNINFIGMSYP
jgi:hypothetical protein